MKIFRFGFSAIISFVWLWGFFAVDLPSNGAETKTPVEVTPSPTYDPLATPELPDNPSDFDLGKNLYYYHCMPCHGDLGQGLTDEFRSVWVEDHQYCWGRGCHGGRQMDEGFPIPTIVPMIISERDALPQFRDFESLKTYLHDTHPPQYPGRLKDEEYRQLSIYLWEANAKPTLTEIPVATPTLQASSTSTTTPTLEPSPTPVNLEDSPPALVQPSTPQKGRTLELPAILLISGGVVLAIILMISSGFFHQDRSG